MQKVHFYDWIFVLSAFLSGLSFLQGMGLGSMANTASSWHISSASALLVVGQLTKPVAFVHRSPCPWAGSDC
jgi:hypothetical protein